MDEVEAAPGDAQSVAFVGLDRRRRAATYRSMWRGTAIEDPVVLTIVESIDDHLRRSVWLVIAAAATVAVMTVTLVAVGGGGGGALAVVVVTGALAATVLAAHRWLMNRVSSVLDRSAGDRLIR